MICTAHPALFGAQIEKNETSEKCSTCGREEMCIQVWMGNPKRKRTLGRYRCRWENIIKIDL
jgi:hypothetical protein